MGINLVQYCISNTVCKEMVLHLKSKGKILILVGENQEKNILVKVHNFAAEVWQHDLEILGIIKNKTRSLFSGQRGGKKARWQLQPNN